jgi:regulatory protein
MVVNGSAKEIRDVCQHLLAGRDHSKKELLQKLASKNYGRDSALAVIDELASEGWQDDLRYAESYARSRILKGYGPVRIAYELRQNGVDITRDGVYAANLPGAGAAIARHSGAEAEAFDLEAVVKEAAGSWMALLEQVYCKKYRQDKELEAGEWAKRSRFLCQRGFTGAMIADLFEHLNIKLI